MPFPQDRPRRLRRHATLRAMVRETNLRPASLILPLFVTEGKNARVPVSTMPGVFRLSPDEAVKDARAAHEAGVPAVILFGLPSSKDDRARQASNPEGPVALSIKALKQALPELMVMTDVCLCAYMDHGHCGIVDKGVVVNDASLPILAEMAVAHAAAGADVVAPSDMMDGRVGAIRAALDSAGHSEVALMSYAVKYASAFYGPFREAADSAPSFGDRRTYQMDPGNAREALREAAADVAEGADIVMVKPALPYLDVIWRVRQAVDVPVAAYHVSGEYAMIRLAGSRGLLSEQAAIMEAHVAIARAGADLILTYAATDVARLLQA